MRVLLGMALIGLNLALVLSPVPGDILVLGTLLVGAADYLACQSILTDS